ncbi:glycosyltransferase family 2 protein [Hyphobacterium marinum]|uniref:Glycosyltransferase family 2 protein n=1 Tax=Hyphobacterium marinum TaxID=3116574 RepID=A0ABU7LXR5_9PROT|nr:glycosyltransferase family 2 protein [Hyphobacterium sp. Y6023]MEE2566351.1 glycosyltransferase family 2 protein [Hyphobacterium sp. Y6023]
MTAPRVSVVMVSWYTGPSLSESVAAVLAAPGIAEFVLVNHGNPSEVSAELRALAEAHDKLVLIETNANLGFARGCNIGADRATGDYLFFLNPDAIPQPGTTRRLVATGEALDRPFLVGALIAGEDGVEQRGARRGELNHWSAFVGFLGLQRFKPVFGEAFRDIHREHEPLPETAEAVPVTSGAAMLMRRDDFNALGGFDERYFLHVEDIDLCRRVREAGGEVMFEPRARVLHYGSTSEASRLRVEWSKARGLVHYFWKFYPRPLGRLTTILLTPLIVGGVMARAVLLSLFRR